MPQAQHLILLVEEPSMEAFLHALLPRWLPERCSYEVHAFQGKADMLGKLEARLKGYAAWLPTDHRLVVVVDRDDEECRPLKQRLEDRVARAGLQTRRTAGPGPGWQVVTRIAIEELEAWYFGDWAGVETAYPKVPPSVVQRRGLRDPDAIAGGTWEAFERTMQRHGYFKTGLRKIEAARAIGQHLNPNRSRSASFVAFYTAVVEATSPVSPSSVQKEAT